MTIESNIKQLIETATELENATYIFLSLGKENIKATVKLLKTTFYILRISAPFQNRWLVAAIKFILFTTVS